MKFSALFFLSALVASVAVSLHSQISVYNYLLTHTNQAKCDGDCCYNSSESCINQGYTRKDCNSAGHLCSAFQVKSGANKGKAPRCDGADCCLISTGAASRCASIPVPANP